jgi:hypothetical protein
MHFEVREHIIGLIIFKLFVIETSLRTFVRTIRIFSLKNILQELFHPHSIGRNFSSAFFSKIRK